MAISSPANGRLYAIASILIVAGLVSVSVLYYAYTFPRTVTSTVTVKSAEVSVSTASVTVTATYVENALVAACNQAQGSDSHPRLVVGTSSPTLLCIRVYYFGNATTTLNATGALAIEALRYPLGGQPTAFSGASNFTIVTSPSELVLGGPNNLNEGATIAYALTAKPGASGSYELSFNSEPNFYPPYHILVDGQPEYCGSYGEIIAGTGQPSYLFQGFNGCLMTSTVGVTTNSTKYTVAQIDFSRIVLNNNEVYLLISGYGNFTQ